MKIAIPRERRPGELRVAASPDTIKKFISLGFQVTVESGAGAGAALTDEVFAEAGATIAPDEASALGDADIVLKVRRPLDGADGPDEIALMKPGAILIGILAALTRHDEVERYAKSGLTAFALDRVPRISRAQSMDVLSSQSNLAGYKAVLDAAAEFRRAFPMMMTASGTIPPARVLVLGAGVAGLQAIATARRLGAIVSAYDVRAAVKEQVESLGAKFVEVDQEAAEDAETEGGYAREMGADYQKKQEAVLREAVIRNDIVICTALIPGKPAPVLVTEEMVEHMRTGSVIVDLAVETGGNCPLSELDQVVVKHGVTLVGHSNVPSRLATDATAMYAKNVLNFVMPLVDAESGNLAIDWEDEIVQGTLITRDGEIVHPDLVPQEVRAKAS
ncbi:MAG: Re/Si-specific NAD(P)(+) transhydrogenase subunit alpha [Alphaproteobacteria bacterium]